MPRKQQTDPVFKFLESLAKCFDGESTKRLLRIKVDRASQSRLTWLGNRCNEGTLTAAEAEEYRRIITFGTYIDILKAHVRLRMKQSHAKPGKRSG